MRCDVGIALRAEGFVGHGPCVEPLERERVPLGHRLDDARGDSRFGGRDRVVELVPAIDREEIRVGPGHPHEERRAVHLDPVVRVGQPGRDPLGGHASAPPSPGSPR